MATKLGKTNNNNIYPKTLFSDKSHGHNTLQKAIQFTLVTQPMLQRRPNRMELRLMDSYIQILCRFRKCKRKVPPPSLLNNEKSPFTPIKEDFSHPLGG